MYIIAVNSYFPSFTSLWTLPRFWHQVILANHSFHVLLSLQLCDYLHEESWPHLVLWPEALYTNHSLYLEMELHECSVELPTNINCSTISFCCCVIKILICTYCKHNGQNDNIQRKRGTFWLPLPLIFTCNNWCPSISSPHLFAAWNKKNSKTCMVTSREDLTSSSWASIRDSLCWGGQAV